MRLGVIDVGSDTVPLLVVDAHVDAQPLPASSHMIELRLSGQVTDDGRIADSGSRPAAAGVSPSRAHQLLAGAVVDAAAMDLLGVDQLEICPWALREGVILRRLDTLT